MRRAALLSREAVADAVERLIAVLDTVDGDADLEPSLGVAGNDEDREPDGDELDYSECADDLAGIFGVVADGIYSGAVSASAHRTRRTVKRQLARIVARRA